MIKGLSCEGCGKKFTHKTNARRHFVNCHIQKKFECPDCRKLFEILDNMKTNRLSNNCKPDESVSEEESDAVIDSEDESWEKEEQCISVEDVPEVGAHDSDDASADSCDELNNT